MGKPPNYKVTITPFGAKRKRVIRNVVGDTTYMVANEGNPQDVRMFPIRVFFLEDNRRVEVGMANVIIEYSVERYYHIKEKMSNEAGQEIRTVQ